MSVALHAGCDGGASPADDTAPADARAERPALERLLRASMALRGIRPSAEEIASVQADPDAVEGLVDGWLDGPEFGATIRDMHAEQFKLRADLFEVLPATGPTFAGANGRTFYEMFSSVNEAPLALIEEIVLEGRPYTEIVTSETLRVNATGALIWGADYDPAGPEWQSYAPADGRPMWGVLSDPAIWIRHTSNGNNYHRARANLIAQALVCEDFLTRDIPLSGDVDLSDDAAVADAVNSNPDCVSCHQSLDPLAGFLWGWMKLDNSSVSGVNAEGACEPLEALVYDPEDLEGLSVNQIYRGVRDYALCYPISPWVGDLEISIDGELGEFRDVWESLGLRAPGYYGLGTEQTELGTYITEDSRFASCAVKRFYGYLTQTPIEEVPLATQEELLEIFEESGYDAGALAAAVVNSATFTQTSLPAGDEREPIGVQVIRPEQYARLIEDLTGFQWQTDIDSLTPGCETEASCLGEIDIARSDAFGLRSIAGGMDGYRVTFPTHAPTPTKLLTMARYAAEAAGYVVREDLENGGARLLTEVGPETRDEDTIRAQLAALHLRLLAEEVAADSETVGETWTLFSAVLADSDDPLEAWRVTLTAMLQDPRVLFY